MTFFSVRSSSIIYFPLPSLCVCVCVSVCDTVFLVLYLTTPPPTKDAKDSNLKVTPRHTEEKHRINKMKMYKVLSIICLMIIAGRSEEVPTSEDVNETLKEGEEVSKVRFFFISRERNDAKNSNISTA